MDDELTPDVSQPSLTSILSQLGERREQIRMRETLDLPIPRWSDPEIIVRYRPIEHAQIRRAQQAVEKAPKRDQFEAEVNGNIDLLIRGCDSVVARIDGQDYSLKPGEPKGEFTKFDKDLAENLGLAEDATARQVVRKIFFTDGDIMSHAAGLVQWSGYRETEADSELAGES